MGCNEIKDKKKNVNNPNNPQLQNQDTKKEENVNNPNNPQLQNQDTMKEENPVNQQDIKISLKLPENPLKIILTVK